MDNQLLKTPLKIMWNAYKKYVRGVLIPNNNDALKDISYWRNKLFCNIIIYMIPITFIPFVLGEYMSVLNGIPFLAIFDLVVYTILVVIAVNRRLTLRVRKIIFISCLYCLSTALLYYLSELGPGMLYLLALTVTTTVIFSLEAAYYSVLANLIICVVFGLLIHFGFNSTFFNNYTVGSWIAVSSNLITLSMICAVCLNMLIKGLEATIAERKKAEEEVKKLNEELEQKVIQRTAQLQEVNKELEAFSYSISHDLRAPLRAMSGFSQILKEDYGSKLDDEGKRIIETLNYNAIKMGMLIDDLLAFSKLGRKEMRKTGIDMNELTEGVLFDLNKSVKHCAEIKIGNLHKVIADYSLLHQVMFNLISNAVKYSSKKENPVVEIFSEENNGETIFSIKDNGAGFDMQYANKLFGVFQRLHSEKDFEGTGVGLAIVQRIIVKHNGRVWAEGSVNEGAVFYFSLTIN